MTLHLKAQTTAVTGAREREFWQSTVGITGQLVKQQAQDTVGNHGG